MNVYKTEITTRIMRLIDCWPFSCLFGEKQKPILKILTFKSKRCMFAVVEFGCRYMFVLVFCFFLFNTTGSKRG